MFALAVVALVGFVLLTFLCVQERSDLYKEIDSLKEDLIRAELHALNAHRDAVSACIELSEDNR